MRTGDPLEVENLFNIVAPEYDRLNDLLSLGLHRVWKRQMLNWLAPVPGENWLDLCCGTGDLALTLTKFVNPGGAVLGIDSAAEPLALAARRASKESALSISWLRRDALHTGLPSNHFDGAVMAYGLRNLYDTGSAFQELRRLLKPGAKAGILDFNKIPANSIRGHFQRFYLRKVVVPIAAKFGLRDQYAYIEQSLHSFHQGFVQEKLAIEAGFREACHRQIAFGQMGVLLLRN